MRKHTRISFFLAILTGLILASASILPARAVEITKEGMVAADQIIEDDLFISADTVQIDGTINGDLFINSSVATINGIVNGNLIVNSAQLTLNGTVNGSLAFAGQSALLAGPVQGTIYSAGYSIILASGAQIGRNLFFTGYNLETAPGSSIGRDLLAADYQSQINGAVGRNVSVVGSALVIGGKIGQDVRAEVEGPGTDGESPINALFKETAKPLPSGLQILPEAQIGGALVYTSSVEQSGAIQSQPRGGVTYIIVNEKTQAAATQTREEALLAWFIARFRELASLLILGGLTAWLAPNWLQKSGEQVRRPLPAAWNGLGVLTIGFIGAGLAAILIIIAGLLVAAVSLGELSKAILSIGLPGLAMAIGIFLLIITYGSKLAVAQWAGQVILPRLTSDTSHRYWPIFIGILLYVALRTIPVISLLANLGFTLVGLGAIWLAIRRRRLAQPQVEPPAQ